jgi:hypothetical protein
MSHGATLTQLEPGHAYRAIVPQKIPIGGSVQGTKKPGLFKVYVPMRSGATLMLKTSSGKLEVYAPNGQPASDANGQPVAAGQEVKFETPDGTFGWYGVVVRDSTSYKVEAQLRIDGNARDGKDKLVPWNFFYFPFTKVEEEGAEHPSAKWQKKFGGEANKWEKQSYWLGQIENKGGAGKCGHGITKEYVEAYNRWAGEKVVDFANTWWWGHCDAASVASTLFKQPAAAQGFSEADLEYFATEIAMCGYEIELKFFLGGLNNNNRKHPSHTEKPEDRAGQALDGDLASFHEALIEVIKKQGSVGLVDMRAEWAAGKDASPDVWNQATFKFTMEAVQTKKDTGPGDEEANARSLDFKTVLFANADAHNSSGNPENPEGSGWNRECFYTLNFDGQGRAQADHPQNNFKKCFWAKTGKEYYAPRYIFQIKGLNTGKNGPGNPHIAFSQAKTLGLQLRACFGG